MWRQGFGGGMMKTVGTGSSQEAFYSRTKSPTYKPSSSDDIDHPPPPPFSSLNRPNSANDIEDDFVFCTVPSMDEVNHALSSLHRVVDPPTTTNGHEYDWIEPSTSMLQPRCAFQSVYDAIHILQTEPSVKNGDIIVTDESVWEAVVNNEVVRELRDSVYEANNRSIPGDQTTDDSSDGPILIPEFLYRIFINMKAKVIEIVEDITEMVNKLFQSPRDEKKAKGEGTTYEPFEKKLITSSFMLSIMVLSIVVVTQTSRS